MANRQTKRERKEMAKKARLEAIRRAQRRKRLRKVYSGVTVLVALALVGGLIWLSGRAQRERDAELNSLASTTGCSDVVKKTEDMDNQHVAQGTTVAYTISPPTSGNHYGGVAPTGVHDTKLQHELQVHNLEHGHVGIQYKPDVPKEIITALSQLPKTEENKSWVFMAPNPDMEPALAFTAWGKLLACRDASKLEAGKIVALGNEFIEQYRDKSPRESVEGAPAGEGPPPGQPPPPGQSPPPIQSPPPS